MDSRPGPNISDWITLALANLAIYCANPRAIRRFQHRNHRLPNVAAPYTYGESMLWRKLVDRSPLHVKLCDKIESKEIVRQRCPDLATPETFWIGDDANSIPDDVLQGDVFVKTSHGFKQNYLIKQGVVDRANLKQVTDEWLATTHGLVDSEWAYSQISPRLFVE